MTGGQAVVLEARKTLGVAEDPDGSNRDRGGFITEIQERATADLGYDYTGSAWCAEAAREWYRRAGLPHEWINPYTGDICAVADREGWWLPAGKVGPPGALVIKCGVHVEVLEEDHGTWLADIGGNVSNAVRRTARSREDGWRIIAPPFIGQPEPAPQTVRVFGFDDPRLAPALYGGWAEKAARERVIASLPADKRARVRRVNKGGKAPYAFELYPAHGGEWRFGPWSSKAARDEVMEARQKRTGRHMRPWAETRVGGGARPPLTSGSVS